MRMPLDKTVSVIIPARNEVALIGRVLEATLRAVAHRLATARLPHLEQTDDRLPTARPPHLEQTDDDHSMPLPHLEQTDVEVIVVDNDSTDGTAGVVADYATRYGVRLLPCDRRRAPCARNAGARAARGQVLVFVDADTLLPPDGLTRILELTRDLGYQAGILGLASLEGGFRAWCWWTFWGQVRRLPLARAKAMCAAMFCTREVFDTLGPFDEEVSIGEEWPILAGLYRSRPERFVFARDLTALTSSRRMDLQPFGYLRTFGRYVWAVLHRSGRYDYGDHLRHRHGDHLRHADAGDGDEAEKVLRHAEVDSGDAADGPLSSPQGREMSTVRRAR